MFEKLESIETEYKELERKLGSPEVISNQNLLQKYAKAHSDLGQIVNTFREYKEVLQELEDAEILQLEEQDQEFMEMVEAEVEQLRASRVDLEERLRVLLIPKDPYDDKNVIMEIRAGAGGDEASLFAGDLFRMYSRYSERQGWKTEILDSSQSDLGGFKEIIFMVKGKGAYSKLKYESGVHRVQRIPTTESGGRIHTSTTTVAVLPEAEEVDVEIDPNDLRIDLFCSSGPGGQSVNTTQSAVRITHLPTGIVVSCQDEKSQHKNRDRAMKVLRARVMDKMEEEHRSEIDSARRDQVGTGDRSERIRTYNYPQGRVSDHRIGLTLHKLEAVLDGDLDELVEALVTTQQAEELQKVAQ
ncbi:MAG: peptide chain release factor 1 [Clostridia bacterium]|nr:peptide chain release factor 1 [Clostridia bacterium]